MWYRTMTTFDLDATKSNLIHWVSTPINPSHNYIDHKWYNFGTVLYYLRECDLM